MATARTGRNTLANTDEQITKVLVRVLEERIHGFAAAAERVSHSTSSDLAARLLEYAAQRSVFLAELRRFDTNYIHTDEIDEQLDLVEAAEAATVKSYQTVLEHDVSPDLRVIIERHLQAVRAAHADVRTMRDELDEPDLPNV